MHDHGGPTPGRHATARPRHRSSCKRALVVAALTLSCGLVAAPIASAADFTWIGHGDPSATGWSNPANWAGGVAPVPNGAIGTLSLPVLRSDSICGSPTPTDACYASTNDLSGLSLNALQIDGIDGYLLSGNPFTLGSGGLSTTGYQGSGGFSSITAPITLGTNQTWTISGMPNGGNGLGVAGALSGSNAALTVNLSHAGELGLGGAAPPATPPDNEVGDVVVASTDAGNEEFWLYSNLNAADGHSLTLHGVQFFPTGVSIGPLVSNDSAVSVLALVNKTPTSAVSTTSAILTSASATFDSASTLNLPITGAGTNAGSDYSALRSRGTINLGGATLDVSDNDVTGCPAVPAGQVATIISTTGSLTGTFGNAANGSSIATHCLDANYQATAGLSFRINYHTTGATKTVTATAVGATTTPPGGGSSPGGGGQSPSGGGPAGGGPTPNPGTTRGGSSPSSTSSPNPSTGGSGSAAVGSKAPAGSTASTSRARAVASLKQALTPTTKAARIGALLKTGGLTVSFRAPGPGVAGEGWYQATTSAKTARIATAPILLASGRLVYSAAGTRSFKISLTAAGKRLLAHAKQLRLTAKEVFAPRGRAPITASVGVVLRR